MTASLICKINRRLNVMMTIKIHDSEYEVDRLVSSTMFAPVVKIPAEETVIFENPIKANETLAIHHGGKYVIFGMKSKEDFALAPTMSVRLFSKILLKKSKVIEEQSMNRDNRFSSGFRDNDRRYSGENRNERRSW